MDDNGAASVVLVVAILGMCLWGCHSDRVKANRLDQMEATANQALDLARQSKSDVDEVKSTLESHNID